MDNKSALKQNWMQFYAYTLYSLWRIVLATLPIFSLFLDSVITSSILHILFLSTKIFLPFMHNLSFVWERVLIFNFLLADRTWKSGVYVHKPWRLSKGQEKSCRTLSRTRKRSQRGTYSVVWTDYAMYSYNFLIIS